MRVFTIPISLENGPLTASALADVYYAASDADRMRALEEDAIDLALPGSSSPSVRTGP